uniref:Uncharacterized protein n=1 Tax=Ditylenchus dipsaci TaxID=166011 RepID=A0A915DN34_9BILA
MSDHIEPAQQDEPHNKCRRAECCGSGLGASINLMQQSAITQKQAQQATVTNNNHIPTSAADSTFCSALTSNSSD